MSLIWFDGFEDYYSTDTAVLLANMRTSGWAYVNNARPWGQGADGTGTAVAVHNSSGTGSEGFVLAIGERQKLVIGFHYLIPDSGWSSAIALSWHNGIADTYQDILFGVNGQRAVVLLKNGVVIATSPPNMIAPNVWYYYELKADRTTGFIELRVNEEVVISTTFTPSFVSWNMIHFLGADSFRGDYKVFDNLYVLDYATATAPFINYLGEVFISSSVPQADAGPNEFNIGAGVGPEHYKVVDEYPYNDADYLTVSEDGRAEWFTTSNVPVDTIQVYAVAVVARTRKGSGSANYKTTARLGSTVLEGATRTISNDYTSRIDILEQKPGGGSWTITDANALEIGFKSVL